ncbi:hypothetical protein Zmor_026858 [Zophobas morio]|uniref:Uncharacterized protein n=1 Tax=Zophobas morio TaxID=2755281 RepID=A0AA38HUK8_9CUCU|nr:hypothetical protein Zmor_026858 [Zophobas morio]
MSWRAPIHNETSVPLCPSAHVAIAYKKNLVYLRCGLEELLLSRDNTLSLVCIHSAAKLYNSANNGKRTKCLLQGRHASICVIVDPETNRHRKILFSAV